MACSDNQYHAAKLRQQAEQILREKTSQLPEDLKNPSPEKMKDVLCELQVHQIELEMQNEELRRAQAELEAARTRYFDLYDLAPIGYVTVSEKGLILEANLTAATLLGVVRSKMTKWPISRFIFSEDQDIYYQYHKQLFETGTPQTSELRMVKKDGLLFWGKVDAVLAQGADGLPVCHAVISDITDRKRTEDAIVVSEVRYRRLFEAAYDGILILKADSGQIIDVNPFFENILGYSHQEFLGKKLWEIGLFKNSAVSRDAFLELQNKGHVHYENMPLETKGGRRIAVEFVSNIYRVGREKVIQCNIRDVTDRVQAQEDLQTSRDELEMRIRERTQELTQAVEALKKEVLERRVAEKAVRQAEERYRSLTVATTQIIWTTDAHGQIVGDMSTWRAFTGQSVEEILGFGWINALHPDDRDRTANIWAQSIQHKNFYQVEYRIRRHDGIYRDMSVRGIPIIEPDGLVREWVGACTDITERKVAENGLYLSQERLRLLAAEIQIVEEKQRRQMASDLHDSVGQMLSFAVRELKSLQKSISGKASQSIHEISNQLDDVVRQVRTLSFDLSPSILYDLGFEVAVEDMVEQFAKDRKIQCRFENCSDPKPLTDNSKIFLYRSIRELLINAVKYANACSFKVTLLRLNRDLTVIVEDDGQGFNLADLKDLAGRPRGFGLFSIRERLNHIGGHFEIESEKSKGTKVTLKLPLDITEKGT